MIAGGVRSREVCASLGVRIEMAAGTMGFDRGPDRFRQVRVQALVAAARQGADWERRERSEWGRARCPPTPCP
ncbi:hypothetical protein [Streptomyces sp. NPDC055013]